MKAAAFDYAVPKSVAEATALLGSNGAATAAIAGGQSLLPLLNLRVALPDLVVDLGRLEELKEIAATRTNIRIGALTTHAAIEDGKLPEAFGVLMLPYAAALSRWCGKVARLQIPLRLPFRTAVAVRLRWCSRLLQTAPACFRRWPNGSKPEKSLKTCCAVQSPRMLRST